jgi:hypothetical protein
VDAHERLHLFWAEPAATQIPIEDARWLELKPASVWTSIYDSVSGWSKPSQFELGAEEPRWMHHGMADNLGDGRLDQGIELGARRRRLMMNYLALDSGGRIRQFGIPVSPGGWGYPNLASQGERMIVAFTAADRAWARSPENPTHEDVNSVFIRVSRDGGKNWEAPRLVQRGGQTPAHQLRALLSADGDLHLLWKQPSAAGSVIRHVMSDDDGVHWTGPEDLPAPALDNLGAVLDACGRIQLVAEDLRQGLQGISIVGATWEKGRWSEVTVLTPGMEALDPDIRLTGEGVPMLVFSGRPRSSAVAKYATYYERLDE